jgi:hypothetical protein
VIGGLDAETVLLLVRLFVESQNRTWQADAVNRSVQPLLVRPVCKVQGELDARRPAVDGEDHLAPPVSTSG